MKLVDEIDEVDGHGCCHGLDVLGVELEDPRADGHVPAGLADRTGNPKDSDHGVVVRLDLAHQGVEESGAPAPKSEKTILWDDDQTHGLFKTAEGPRLQRETHDRERGRDVGDSESGGGRS